MSDEPVTDYEIEPGVFPAELLAQERWFVWALDNDRKIPRAPWDNPDHIDKFVSWKEDSMWVDFETADEWADKVSRFGHASCIPPHDDNSTERLIFFDFDDCRDPETGAIHPHAWKFIEGQGLHAAVSTSGTGLHGFGWGSVPEGYKPSFEHELDAWEHHDEPHMEVYASARFMALTGEHIAKTPVSVPDLGDDVHSLFERFGSERVTGHEREPDISREEIEDVDSTTDVEEIYDAIRHVRPSDIRLRSQVTETRADGTKSLDPCWEQSESGTRLAELDDHWLYRKGNHRLDALQVVALEERIISDASEYPSGDDFREAVDALRDRGAHIPELETSRSPALDIVDEQPEQPETDDSQPAEVETDGGAAADQAGSDEPVATIEQFRNDVKSVVMLADEEDIQHKTARHRIAKLLTKYYNFVLPEEEVRGWRTTLHVFNAELGVYEPRGERFIKKKLERVAGDYVTNQVTNEIVGKVERMTAERGDAFETPPNRLVVGNGILDLHTGELDPYTPHEYHRQRIDVDWNPNAGAPDAIDDFLSDIVADADVDTLYRLIAHSLYREYVTEKAVMLVGGGQNGKSVFLSLVEEFLGQHNVSHRSLQDFDENDFAANQLEGKLANIHPDMGDESVTDMSTFKKLTGRDTMHADVKFESPITFENYATLMFAANEMPVFGEDNHAVWRRWVYVNFPYTFDDTDPDAKDETPKRVLMRDLTDERELEALLVRCQEEIQAWHEGREWYPDAMRPEEVRKQMKKAAEPVFNFSMTCLREDEDEYLTKDRVRQCYREYATQEGLPKITADRFGERLVNLRDLSIESARKRVDGQRQRVYQGVAFTDRGRQALGVDEPGDSNDQATVDDVDDKRQEVLEIVRELVEQNDNEPVSTDMVIGRALSQMGRATAENTLDALMENGTLYEPSDQPDHVLPR